MYEQHIYSVYLLVKQKRFYEMRFKDSLNLQIYLNLE